MVKEAKEVYYSLSSSKVSVMVLLEGNVFKHIADFCIDDEASMDNVKILEVSVGIAKLLGYQITR